jgi:hypothetical protein
LEEFVEEFGCPLGTFVSEDDRLRSGSRIGDYSFLVKPIERIPIVRLPSAGNTAVSETRQMKKGEHRIVDFVIVYFHFRFLSISRRRGMTHNVPRKHAASLAAYRNDSFIVGCGKRG